MCPVAEKLLYFQESPFARCCSSLNRRLYIFATLWMVSWLQQLYELDFIYCRFRCKSKCKIRQWNTYLRVYSYTSIYSSDIWTGMSIMIRISITDWVSSKSFRILPIAWVNGQLYPALSPFRIGDPKHDHVWNTIFLVGLNWNSTYLVWQLSLTDIRILFTVPLKPRNVWTFTFYSGNLKKISSRVFHYSDLISSVCTAA